MVSQISRVRDYDLVADRYDRFHDYYQFPLFRARFFSSMEAALAHLSLTSSRQPCRLEVLELGAGSGLITYQVAAMGHLSRITAVELSPQMIARATRRRYGASVRFIEQDALEFMGLAATEGKQYHLIYMAGFLSATLFDLKEFFELVDAVGAAHCCVLVFLEPLAGAGMGRATYLLYRLLKQLDYVLAGPELRAYMKWAGSERQLSWDQLFNGFTEHGFQKIFMDTYHIRYHERLAEIGYRLGCRNVLNVRVCR